MPNMGLYRLADLNLNYKVQEILENYGFTSGKYKVYDGYLNELDLNTNHIWPTVTIEMGDLVGRNVELGSKPWKTLFFAIDVYARTDSQRDDVMNVLWDELNDTIFTLYDFNDGFPSSVGDYSGLTTIGSYSIEEVTGRPLIPPEGESVIGEKHHSILDGILYLSNC